MFVYFNDGTLLSDDKNTSISNSVGETAPFKITL